jgi:hypothetical protein
MPVAVTVWSTFDGVPCHLCGHTHVNDNQCFHRFETL